MRNLLAYLDEFGTNALNVTDQNVSTHFIVTAIIVDEDDEKGKIEARLEAIRRRHFQAGEMKSRNVGDNHKRRLRIIRDLHDIV